MEKYEIAIDVMKRKDLTDDEKLLKVFEIYKEGLKENYSQLYYALLAWKDTHRKEFL